MNAKRDGFIVKRIGEGEVAFIACDKNGSMRDRTLHGLMINMSDECFVVDSRDERP